MKVLVGCEFSGLVRDAFAAFGHDAMSCDLLPSDSPGQHYQGDIFDVIDYPWDLGVFHPPCTDTAVSGARHFKVKKMKGQQQRSVSFFFKLLRRSSHIDKRVFEQPVSIISSLYKKPDQIIQPWQFGHGETKATCLWVDGLELLRPSNVVSGRANNVHKMPPSPDRWKKRSATYIGVAEAMAKQWGGL